ncbi:unnamed protein product [Blepharisma stoltei]|uniref:Uncharacterized protein n=1 Tax=Blepharisma stoltei TaxID=1481888 RepID=A0AAU9JFQ4_9CILI|nr:unnamed protein product [Blepharisma stoltei]
MEKQLKLNIPLYTLRERLKFIEDKGSAPASPSHTSRPKKSASNSTLPDIHKRSSSSKLTPLKTDETQQINLRDVSYRLETLKEIKGRNDINENQLKQIISGKESEIKLPLPTNLSDLEKEAEKVKAKQGKTFNSTFFSEIEEAKKKLSKNQKKRKEFFIKESLYYYKAQSDWLFNKVAQIHENPPGSPKVHSRSHSQSKLEDRPLQTDRPTKNRGELDLGAPSSRREVELLRYWLDCMLDTQVIQSDKPIDQRVSIAQLIYTICFKEIIRQVSVHCLERGQLMEKLWNSQLELYSKSDDISLKKLEEMQEQHIEFIGRAEKNWEEEIKKEQAKNEELLKAIKSKDKNIDELNNEKKEMKLEIEKIRKRSADLGESINESSSRRFVLQKDKCVSAVPDAFDESSQTENIDLEYELEKTIRIKRPKSMKPVIMAGYFDMQDQFHAQQLFRRHSSGRVESIDLPDEIIAIVPKKNKSTWTEEIAEVAADATPVRHNFIDWKSEIPNTKLNFGLYAINMGTFGIDRGVQAPEFKADLKISIINDIEIRKRFIRKNTSEKKKTLTKEVLVTNLNKLDKHIDKLDNATLITSVASQTNNFDVKKVTNATKKASKILRKDRNIIKDVYNAIEDELVDTVIHEAKAKKKIANRINEKHREQETHSEGGEDTANNSSTNEHQEIDEALPAKLVKNIGKFKKVLSKVLIKKKPAEALINNDKAKKYAHKLRIKLDSMYSQKTDRIQTPIKSHSTTPISVRSKEGSRSKDLSPIIEKSIKKPLSQPKIIRDRIKLAPPKTFFDAYVQTDLSGDNIFLKNMMKKMESDEDEIKEMSLKTSEKFHSSSRRISRKFQEDNSGSFTQSLPELNDVMPVKPKAAPKYMPKVNPKQLLIVEAFLLGQVQRKIHLTHPGQKLLTKIMDSLRENKVKLSMSIKILMKIINQVYAEKISLSRESADHKSHEASIVLYDMLIHRYGLRSVAENKYKQVVHATISYSEKFIRIKNFYKFLGLEGNFTVEDWNFYLYSCEFMECCNIGPYIYNEDFSPDHFSPYDRAIHCASVFFEKKLSPVLFQGLLNRINMIRIQESPKYSGRVVRVLQRNTEKVNTDEFLSLLLEYYQVLKNKLSKALWPTGEIPNSLELEEFLALMKGLPDSSLVEEELVKIFEDHSVYTKGKNGDIVKAIMHESILSFGVDNSIIPFNDIKAP